MARPTASHYEVLALTPAHLEGQAPPSQAQVVKKAYHRALLRHHPDKAHAGDSHNSNAASSSPPSSSSSAGGTYTVDQIQEAYAVLSDRRRRGSYDRSLSLSSSHPHHHQQQQAQPGTATWTFRTGVETVDLDDLSFDEHTGTYHRSCRCGNARGFSFDDEDLAACEDDGVLLVGCKDCSLWLRVLFAPAGEDEDDDDPAEKQQVVHDQSQRQVSGSGSGFRFNFSFNLGVSIGGSVSASAGRSGR